MLDYNECIIMSISLFRAIITVKFTSFVSPGSDRKNRYIEQNRTGSDLRKISGSLQAYCLSIKRIKARQALHLDIANFLLSLSQAIKMNTSSNTLTGADATQSK